MSATGVKEGLFRRYRDTLLPMLLLLALLLALTAGWDRLAAPDDRIFSIFFKPENLGNILRQNAHYGILAVALTFVIISGGIDLSVGSLLAFSSVIAASLIERRPGAGTGYALMVMAAGVVAGLVPGLLNGFLITYARAAPEWAARQVTARLRGDRPPGLGMNEMQPFIVTLAMMSVARGLAFLWTGGRGIDIYGRQPEAFAALGRNLVIGGVGLPWPGIIFLLTVILGHLLLTYTRFGRWLYAIGSSQPAAVLAGIPVARVKILVYGLSGALCGLAALIYTSVQNAGRPDDGVGFELDAIAAAVIGGASLSGGRGRVSGTLIGALIIGVLNNVLGLRGIDPNMQRVLKGIIIIAAVLLQREQKQ